MEVMSSSEEPVQNPPASRPASPSPRGAWLGWLFLVFVIGGVIFAAAVQMARRPDFEPVPEPIRDAPAFTLTDDRGTSFSSEQLAGKPYVIDFIFTRCGGQCPRMTVQMRDLQEWLKRSKFDVNLVSVTVDPEYDTPEVLADYAQRFKADREKWRFLTGPREYTYPIIRDGFMLGVDENTQNVPISEQFIHSDRFVLVDAEGKIRGFYPAQDEEEMLRLRRVINSMMAEKRP